MNKVVMIGNLVKDPEIREVKIGNDTIKKCKFRIAVARINAESQADFFNVVVWRGLAESCYKFLKKGSKCCVIGRLQNNIYETQDGQKRYSIDIVADEVEFLNRVIDNNSITEERVVNEQPLVSDADLIPTDDDQMPF